MTNSMVAWMITGRRNERLATADADAALLLWGRQLDGS